MTWPTIPPLFGQTKQAESGKQACGRQDGAGYGPYAWLLRSVGNPILQNVRKKIDFVTL